MSAKTIAIDNVEVKLAELLSLVGKGTEVILTKKNRPVARLLPVEPRSKARIAGLHAGAIWMGDDFDEPLPEAFWAGE
ncbi:MAG: type II toxin-antitoxin system prevent-host-death family antitoxin [Chloroflexi bacterium]|nr:type II toxin-antitoxin system prevent-host-death family antitoxin [Chloroflexota bacterium]